MSATKRHTIQGVLSGLISALFLIAGPVYGNRTKLQKVDRPVTLDRFIVPGLRIGALKLGQKREQALEAFPFKQGIDQQDPGCGITYTWVDSTQGNVFIEFQRGIIRQIGSATPRYRTREGITSYSSPEKVRHFYRNLEAYVLPIPSLVAFGGRPLVFWVSRTRGIAFAFAYDSETSKRYLYEIIIFRPETGLCVENIKLDARGVQKLSPYSLESNPP